MMRTILWRSLKNTVRHQGGTEVRGTVVVGIGLWNLIGTLVETSRSGKSAVDGNTDMRIGDVGPSGAYLE